MTQEEFNKLPMVLTRAQVSEVLGISSNKIQSLVAENKLQTLAPDDTTIGVKGLRRRIKKESVAKLCGLSL